MATSFKIHMFPCLSDNYGFLIHDEATGETATIDTPDADEILRQAELKGWKITQIWNTHWHPDHAGGNAKIKAETGCKIHAPAGELERIDPYDTAKAEGDIVNLGAHEFEVLDVPGHTSGHIAYVSRPLKVAFVGDALFALGCGRLFEGTPDQMWHSLSKLQALEDDVAIYCAHEYTEANAAFCETIERDNMALKAYIEGVKAKRGEGLPTVPTTIGAEKAANPFFRAGIASLQALVGHEGDAVATFAEIRQRKDNF